VKVKDADTHQGLSQCMFYKRRHCQHTRRPAQHHGGTRPAGGDHIAPYSCRPRGQVGWWALAGLAAENLEVPGLCHEEASKRTTHVAA
jgi:hypothetical protein